MKITFLAALAGQNTSAKWLSMGAEGDAKISLETSADQADTVVDLRQFAGKLLRVTIEAE
jgi:hypothetical protein